MWARASPRVQLWQHGVWRTSPDVLWSFGMSRERPHAVNLGAAHELEPSTDSRAAGIRSTSNPPAIAKNIISINPDENDPVRLFR